MIALSRAIFVACLVAGGLFSSAARAAALEIEWEVENRFPFYRKASTFQSYKETALKLQEADSWILQTERKLQDLHREKFPTNSPDRRVQRDNAEQAWNGWASLTREDTCWDRQNREWTRRDRCDDFVLPQSHRVIARVKDGSASAQCQWELTVVGDRNVKADHWPARRKSNRENQKLNRPIPCSEPITVEVPYSANGITEPAKGGFHTVLRVTSGNDSKQETIRVNDLLVVGMGDSFAAGVGNPDKPARIDWNPNARVQFVGLGSEPARALPKRFGGGETDPASSLAGAQSEWMDIRCFRSQYGPQFRAALHLAVSLPHSSVTYIDLACNGARIIEGLLSLKSLDEGYRRGTTQPPSQIETASKLLCSQKQYKSVAYRLVAANTAAGCRNLGPSQICEYGDENGVIEKYQNVPGLSKTMAVCDARRGDAFKRPIDVLLLSIGGNDVGFAPMVADVLIDNKTDLQRLMKRFASWKGISHPGKIGLERLELLNSKYAVLNRALSEHLPWRPEQKAPDQAKPIFLTAYPMPLDDRQGQRCGAPSNARAAGTAFSVSKLFEDFKVKNTRPPVSERMKDVIEASCALNLRRFGWLDGGSNARELIIGLTKPGALCAGFADFAKQKPGDSKIPWHYVGDFLPDFRGHGFCAYQTDFNNELAIPEGVKFDPWRPDYKYAAPYASRNRWLRTPNDAYVITNWYIGYKVNDSFNLLSAATTTSMHPTAEGFAAMADNILERVTRYLCREGSDLMRKEKVCAPALPGPQATASP